MSMLLWCLLDGCASPGSSGNSKGSAASASSEERVVQLDVSNLDPNDPDYLRSKLAYYGLKPLVETPDDEVTERYRFLYCRWIAPAGLFEIDFRKDGSGTYRAMTWTDESSDHKNNIHTTIWSGQTHGMGHWTDVKTRGLTGKDLAYFRFLIDRWKLYGLPWYDGRMMMDGSSWFIELVSGDKHHELFRYSPENDPVRWFGTEIIDLAIDSPFIPIQ